MHTTGSRLELWKTASLAGLKEAVPKTIWTPPAPINQQLLTPQLVSNYRAHPEIDFTNK